MSDDDFNESLPRSKFEWGPDDVTLLSQEEADAAMAEYLEWRRSSDTDVASTDAPRSADADDQ
jgi:hypothetical protein